MTTYEKSEKVKRVLLEILRLKSVSLATNEYGYSVTMIGEYNSVMTHFDGNMFDIVDWKYIVKTCVDGYTQEVLKVR